MKRDCAVTDIFTISHILNNNDAIIVCPDFHADRQCNCETVLCTYHLAATSKSSTNSPANTEWKIT